jgi:murein DD-endopeptidase MepM/ murein hydrolase activator NlpD
MSNGSKIAAGAAALLMLPLLIAIAAGGVVSAIFGHSGAAASCTIAGASTTGVTGYEPDQITNAATIAAVGKQMQIPEHGIVTAIATAIQESGLRNLDYGDRDSLGLFQQRPSQGWGTPTQVTDPTYAATAFYRHLLAVPGWQHMTLNEAAQTVQRSATPNAYGQHERPARALAAAVSAATCKPQNNAEWLAPVTGRCTSGFGPRNGEFHRGQDIAAPIGTPIVAAHGGRVIDSGPTSGYGLWVRIQHPTGVITTYGHNNRNLVTTGQTVHTGQSIAEVGNRGHSTGPHLHFQLESSGQPINPRTFYQQHNAPLCGQ